MSNSRNHGGKRDGAGRPLKWELFDVFRIGGACEKLFRDASRAELRKQVDNLIGTDRAELASHFQQANAVKVENRREWLTNEAGGSVHMFDVDIEISSLNEKIRGEASDNRCFTVKATLPRGTRTCIINDVATANNLQPKQVDNIWQAYRRAIKRMSN